MFALWSPSRTDGIRTKKSNTKVHPELIYQEQDEGPGEKSPILSRAANYRNKLSKVFNSKGIKLKAAEDETPRNDYSLKNFTLQFGNKYLEKNFNIFRTERVLKFIRKIFIILFVLNLI